MILSRATCFRSGFYGVVSLVLFSQVCSGATGLTDTKRVITLEGAYDRTLATDQAIRIAFYEVKKANLLPWSALTRLGPRLSGRVDYGRAERSTTVSVQAEGGTASSVDRITESRGNTGTLGLVLDQPLIDLTVFPAYRFGKLSAQTARWQYQFTIRQMLFGVAQAYYDVLRQERLVSVNRETQRLAEEQLRFAKKRAEFGEAKRSDVLRAEVTVESARRALVESINLLEFTRNTLGNILNLPPLTPFELVEPPDYPRNLPSFEDLFAQAKANREDLRVKSLAIEKDIALKQQIISGYAPRVSAQLNSALGQTSGVDAQSNRNWQAMISVSVPFFTGGQREIDVQVAKNQIVQSKLIREQAEKVVESEVRQAWLTVNSLVQTLKALHAEVFAAEQGYHDLEIQYREGTATSLDVLSALNQLNRSRKDLAVETYGYQVALRNLQQVAGVFQQSRVQKSSSR